eukprot:2001201-Rhodomonas_salina.7
MSVAKIACLGASIVLHRGASDAEWATFGARMAYFANPVLKYRMGCNIAMSSSDVAPLPERSGRQRNGGPTNLRGGDWHQGGACLGAAADRRANSTSWRPASVLRSDRS